MLLFTGTSVPESQIFGKTDVREVQGNQEKRLYSYYLL